jgi:hypothetical protein
MTNAYNRPEAAHWSARIGLPNMFVFLISSTRPYRDDEGEVHWTPIPGYGDEVEFLDWSAVVAMTVREIPAVVRAPVETTDDTPQGKRKGKGKKSKPAPALVIPAERLAWAQDKAAEEYPNNPRQRVARTKGYLMQWLRSEGVSDAEGVDAIRRAVPAPE